MQPKDDSPEIKLRDCSGSSLICIIIIIIMGTFATIYLIHEQSEVSKLRFEELCSEPDSYPGLSCYELQEALGKCPGDVVDLFYHMNCSMPNRTMHIYDDSINVIVRDVR